MRNPWRGLRGLPASLWLLFTATLINRAGTMVLPFLVLYLTRTQGYTPGEAGAVLALYGTVAIFTAPFAGRLCDRFGPLPVIVAGLLGNGAVLLAFPLAHGPWIALAVLGMAATNETTRPASLAAVTTWAAPAERRMAFALTRLAINLGVSVGPALAGFLVTRSFRFLFLIDAATALAAGVVLLLAGVRLGLTGRRPEVATPGGARRRPAGTSPYADARFLLFLAVNVLVTMIFFQHNSTMPFYLVHSLGLSPAVYGLMFTLNTAIIVLLEVPLNTAMAGWPLGRSLALGSVLCGLGFGSLALVSSAWGVAATVVIWTFGEMILFPTAAAYSSHFASADRQGAYMGAYSMSAAAAFALGPWAGTRILEAWGGRVLWGMAFLCGLAAAGLFWRLEEAPVVPERAEAVHAVDAVDTGI
ncbi:MAG TPA: MFS transporter [Thermoanaerobaculia bacterium]|nr:MFS transporter [Thermoanaerobaculia bacterium]